MSVLATDDFNRANASTPGANWTSVSGQRLGIQSNQADVATANTSVTEYYNAVTWPDDQYSQAVAPTSASHQHAVAVRVAAAAVTYYGGGHDLNNFGDATKRQRVWKVVAGAQTSLGLAAGVVANGDTLKLTVQGTSLELFVNGVSVLTPTDSAIASGSAGVSVRHSAGNVGLFDDWEGGDIAAAPGQPTMRRWGGVPGMTPRSGLAGRSW